MNFDVESLFLRVIKVNYPVFLILLGILLLLFNPSADAAKIVRVGVYDNKPLVFIDDDGKPQGIFIDLLEHVASKEHWDLKYTPGKNEIRKGSVLYQDSQQVVDGPNTMDIARFDKIHTHRCWIHFTFFCCHECYAPE